MPWVGFEPTISAGERPKTYALDRAATGTGYQEIKTHKFNIECRSNKTCFVTDSTGVNFNIMYHKGMNFTKRTLLLGLVYVIRVQV